MSELDETWWARARQARDVLVAMLGDDPSVALIDIGYTDEQAQARPGIRLHLRPGARAPHAPRELDGIPVVVLTRASEISLEGGSG